MKIEEEKQPGRITLSALSSGNRQAVMFKSPLSDTEYFVAEYRKKGDGVGQIDSALTGSGVIVYRVNPAYREYGNWGKDDYIYVFRQGETGLGDARGNIRNAQLSTRGAPFRSSVGTNDPSKGVVDGAIVLSDGRNTGIVVSVVSETDDSATIDVTFPTMSEDELWPAVEDGSGNAQFGAAVFDVDTIGSDGKLYAFMQQGSGRNASFVVMERYEDDRGAGLVQLGEPISGEYLNNASLAVHEGSLFFLATNGANLDQALLKRYDAISNSWTDVAQVNTASYIQSPCSLASVAGSLYVLVGTILQPSNGSGEATQVYRLASTPDGDVLDKVGEPLPVNYLMAPRLFEFDGALAVACGDNGGTETSNTYLLRLQGDGSWTKLDLTGSSRSAGFIDVSVHAGKAYLLAGFGNQDAAQPAPRLYVIAPDGRVEKSIEISWLRCGLAKGSALEVSGDRLYLAAVMKEGPASCARTFSVLLSKFEENEPNLSSLDQWQQLGGTTYSPTDKISAALLGDRIYVGAVNSTSNRVAFLSHALLPAQSIISVTMPTTVRFVIEEGADATTPLLESEGQRPATFAIHNNSSSPVRAFVSGVSVASANLVDREEDLATRRSIMMGMGDPGGAYFAGWLPAASDGAPADGFMYYPFGKDAQGVIEGNASSASVALFGKLGATGWEDGGQFTVTPTFTVTTQSG